MKKKKLETTPVERILKELDELEKNWNKQKELKKEKIKSQSKSKEGTSDSEVPEESNVFYETIDKTLQRIEEILERQEEEMIGRKPLSKEELSMEDEEDYGEDMEDDDEEDGGGIREIGEDEKVLIEKFNKMMKDKKKKKS
ncbi:hypothetical protein MSUIS_05810 [Mycoplasma suis KI3806]|uniref:Uncharacterized protein n=1 Tax=Mycoplasma suis (strain KI_3806) TaxID=708248 RepID=F0V1Z3_MYCS3|nr:hypothetical protein [Mycoplasma suis]CBZ40674.1 hypothetical protein MSUIS_05810 [Mycoplasma suis KI3806]